MNAALLNKINREIANAPRNKARVPFAPKTRAMKNRKAYDRNAFKKGGE